ncbi:hypothetical protein Ahy_A09g044340 [Arachis hypogaea]|uniref:Histidine kinase domain-containing protein n=1 Tax=Arachis hypogaea TaxID=3818 RepID=A0A445BJX2_ARAHY|nr:hypothetical protein Ahy_A09g044340 [Arachis hypogaea]
MASPLSQSHSATLLLPLIELLLTPSLPSLWPLNEHTEERREDRRELERSLEEAPKQPSLVAVPQHPATAAATASARRRPCSPPIHLLLGQLLRLFFGQPLFELRSPLFSPLRRVFEPLFSLCSAAFQPLFRHCLPPFSHLRRDLKLLPFPVLSFLSSRRDAKHYIEFWKQIPPNEPYLVILGDVRDKLYNTRERARQLLANGTFDIPEETTFTNVKQSHTEFLLNNAMTGVETEKATFGLYTRKGKYVECLLFVSKKLDVEGEVTGVFCFLQTASPELQQALHIQRLSEQTALKRLKALTYMKSYLNLEMVEFTLHQLFVACLSKVMTKSKAMGIHIINEVTEHIMTETLYGDSLRLQQVLADFLLICINFTPTGGQVVVAAFLTKDQLGKSVHLANLEISITHDGVGVPETLLNQMFGRDGQPLFCPF